MHLFMSPGLALSSGALRGVSARNATIIAAIFIGVPALIAIWVLVRQRFRK